MTDQTTPNVTGKDSRLARDWAEHILNTPEASLPMETAAARVILAVLPPRPTLADMTEEERAACQWMQADTELWGRVVIVLHNAGGGRAVTLNREGHMAYEDHGTITPRPDLPRLTWPGDQKPAPALPDGWRLADHPEHGRVIVTNPNPDRDGRVYYMLASENRFGYDSLFCIPGELTYIDGDNQPPP